MATECKCPNPPGGVVRCPDNQMAVCLIEHGQEPVHQCVMPPIIHDSLALINWTISQVTGHPRSDFREVNPIDIQMLSNGRFYTGSRRVTFTLTEKIRAAIDDVSGNMQQPLH